MKSIGGGLRDWWEAKRLKPKIEKIRETEGNKVAEKTRAIMLLGTFMLAAGMLTGEAFLGVESAVFAVVDELPTGEEMPQMDGDMPILDANGEPVTDDQVLGDLSWYPYARFASFLGMNLLLGLGIYMLFRKAGIIGPKDELLEAELE